MTQRRYYEDVDAELEQAIWEKMMEDAWDMEQAAEAAEAAREFDENEALWKSILADTYVASLDR